MHEIDWKRYAPLFTPGEFACKCGCGIVHVHPEFIERLYQARLIARKLVRHKYHDIGMGDMPFVINSGCRCPAHNASPSVRGARESAHITTSEKPGYAADIVATTGPRRFVIVESLLQAGFERIQPRPDLGIVHSDNDPDKLRPWMG